MKYLSVILFALLMSWTWSVVHSQAAVSLETHIGIQNKLAMTIADAIKSRKPLATDLIMDTIWSEPVMIDGKQAVIAHFAYHYEESAPPATAGATGDAAKANSPTSTAVSGQATLVRMDEDASGLEKWTITQMKTNSDAITFTEPMVITTGDGNDGSDATPADVPAATDSH